MNKRQRAPLLPCFGAMVMTLAALGFTAQRLHGQTVYHACYVPNTGILYIVEVEGACKNDKHEPISWTVGVEGHLHRNLLELGVGDDHPQYLLRADAPDGHSLDAADNDPVDALFVGDDGNIGIGTTNPGARLHVYTDDGVSPLRVNRNTNSANVLSLLVHPNGYGYMLVGDETGSARAMINSRGPSFFTGGNVGIGTNNPGEKLEVDGRIAASGIKFPDGTVQTTKGLSEVTILSQTESIDPGVNNAAIALYCGVAGEILSGGYQWAGPEGRTWAAYPDPDVTYGHRYVVKLWNPTDAPLQVWVYAVCVK